MKKYSKPSFRRFPVLLVIILLMSCSRMNTGNSDAPAGMIRIDAGGFVMGTSKSDTEGESNTIGTRKQLYVDEKPERKIYLKSFYIDKYEVTNADYKKYVDSAHGEPPVIWQQTPIKGRENYPVNGVTWFQAYGYCEWAGKRLPTEEEWERTARSTDGREFPWGNTFDTAKIELANIGNQPKSDLYPVGSFEAGKSPDGAYDLIGNVWEWTADWYKPYPGNNEKNPDFGETSKVLRGGGWGGGQGGHYAMSHFFRAAHRFYAKPYISYIDVGFRCAKDDE